VRAVLKDLGPSFGKLYASEGRPSIPPEQLLSALLLQVFYGIRSDLGLPHLRGGKRAPRQTRVAEPHFDFDDAVPPDARAHGQRQTTEDELRCGRCHVVESLMRVRRVSQLKSCGGDDFAPRLHG
jgi:hypothetical protein